MSVLVQNKDLIKVSYTEGMALIQYGNMLPATEKTKPKINWIGKHAIKVKIEPLGTGFNIGSLDEKINKVPIFASGRKVNIKYFDKGIYYNGDNNIYVRFFRPKSVPNFIVPLEKNKNIEKDLSEKISKKLKKDSPKKNIKVESELTKILFAFATNINNNYGVFTDSEVDIKKYVEDYIRKDIEGKKFDLDKATFEFNEFMKTKALPAIEEAEKNKVEKKEKVEGKSKKEKIEKKKKKVKKEKIRFTQKEFDLWFESGRKGPVVADLRNILIKKGIKNITNKTTKKEMREIVKKRVR